MYTFLQTAENWLTSWLEQPGKWKASVVPETGIGNELAETLTAWREMQTGIHVVLRILRGDRTKTLRQYESPHIFRVVRGVASIATGVECEEGGKTACDVISTAELAAGSIHFAREPYGMISVCPIFSKSSNSLMLLQVNKASSEMSYLKAPPMKQQHLEWLLAQYKAIYSTYHKNKS